MFKTESNKILNQDLCMLVGYFKIKSNQPLQTRNTVFILS